VFPTCNEEEIGRAQHARTQAAQIAREHDKCVSRVESCGRAFLDTLREHREAIAFLAMHPGLPVQEPAQTDFGCDAKALEEFLVREVPVALRDLTGLDSLAVHELIARLEELLDRYARLREIALDAASLRRTRRCQGGAPPDDRRRWLVGALAFVLEAHGVEEITTRNGDVWACVARVMLAQVDRLEGVGRVRPRKVLKTRYLEARLVEARLADPSTPQIAESPSELVFAKLLELWS
jgi:hypothetical protein